MMLSIQNYLQSSPCTQAVLYSAIAVEVVYFLLLFRALLMHLSAVLVLKLMATLVNSFIFDISCFKTLLPWTIYMPKDDRITVQGYYKMVVSKQPADVQDHLSNHISDEVRVGNTKNELDKVGNTGISFTTFVMNNKKKKPTYPHAIASLARMGETIIQFVVA